MQTDRRSFLSRIITASAGMVVAPTLAETLAIGAKKYFFLSGVKKIDEGIARSPVEKIETGTQVYMLKPPLYRTDTDDPWGRGQGITYCKKEALPYYLKNGWYIIG